MKSSWFLLSLIPVLFAVILYQVDEFDAGSLPKSTLSWIPVKVSKHNDHILEASHKIGEGHLPGPEDLAYDSEEGFIYTSCNDGCIRRLKLTTNSGSDLKVEDYVYVGGRPLGIAFGSDKQLIVAESDKGLMKVTKEGKVELLTDEAEGLKFRLTDGVDVADDGVIYFTDASSVGIMPKNNTFFFSRPYTIKSIVRKSLNIYVSVFPGRQSNCFSFVFHGYWLNFVWDANLCMCMVFQFVCARIKKLPWWIYGLSLHDYYWYLGIYMSYNTILD
ncbi:hypothetical protein MKW92_036592 [Papaver armeniacum]|nr:hypothetical protein MKW92_036592 [Papaver armeniacum]